MTDDEWFDILEQRDEYEKEMYEQELLTPYGVPISAHPTTTPKPIRNNYE